MEVLLFIAFIFLAYSIYKISMDHKEQAARIAALQAIANSEPVPHCTLTLKDLNL